MTYRISQKDAEGIAREVGTVEADSYSRAASAALPVVLRRKPFRVVAERVTGEHNKSGWFQAYRLTPDGLSSTGITFHVM